MLFSSLKLVVNSNHTGKKQYRILKSCFVGGLFICLLTDWYGILCTLGWWCWILVLPLSASHAEVTGIHHHITGHHAYLSSTLPLDILALWKLYNISFIISIITSFYLEHYKRPNIASFLSVHKTNLWLSYINSLLKKFKLVRSANKHTQEGEASQQPRHCSGADDRSENSLLKKQLCHFLAQNASKGPVSLWNMIYISQWGLETSTQPEPLHTLASSAKPFNVASYLS